MHGEWVPGSLVTRKDMHVQFANHFGVVLRGDGLVAHIDKSPTRQLMVKVEHMPAFAAGYPVTVIRPSRFVSFETMWARVNEVAAACVPYGLLAIGSAWNCESFATYVRDGKRVSRQAEAAKGLMILGGVAAGLATLVGIAIASEQPKKKRAI